MWIWIVYPAPAGIAGTAGIAKCLDLLGPTKGSAGGYLINTEYTERARPQSPGKHRHLPDFSGANDGGPPPIFFPRPCRGQMAVLETSYKHMFQDSPD